jgi:hypothetical protein
MNEQGEEMKPGRKVILAAVAALASAAILAAPSAAANVATPTPAQVPLDWNLNAVNIVRGATAPLPKFQIEGLIHMSYVQAAVYDATTKIQGRYRPYHDFAVDPSIVANASPEAAIIAAAYTTLAYYFSDQPATLLDPLKAQYQAALAALPDQGKADGATVGQAAANDIIALRADDGRNAPITFTPGPPGPGVWQFTPPPSLQFSQTPWVAQMTPFMLPAALQFRSDPPPALSSRQWADGFNEVKAYGAANSTVRTPAQTAVGLFWNANVINQYNQAFRDVAVQHGFDLVDTVRLLAMGNLVGADTGIGCLEAKYHYAFWRPITAIRSADIDGNPRTQPDPTWTPLLVTPNHPEYPGAHGCITGAEAEVFAAALGTNRIEVDIHGSATGAPGNFDAVRHFDSVNDLTHEIVDARTWAGLHYRWSSVQGVILGRKTAHWTLQRYFLPTP